MNALVRSELLKLRTIRANAVVAAITLGIAALLGAATVAGAGRDGAAPAGSAGSMANVLTASGLPPLAAFIVGVLASAGEVQYRTIAQTYLTTPRRGRVLAAKALALALAGTCLAVALTTVALLGALPKLLVDGVPVTFVHVEVPRAVGGNLLASALFAVLGVILGILVRNQLVAVVGAAVWALIVEGIIAIVAGHEAVRWLPAAAATALTRHDSQLLGFPVALGVIVGYASVLGLLALRTAPDETCALCRASVAL